MSNMSDRHISLYSTVHNTSINNMMPNSKFSNKEILQFNLCITTNFDLTCPKNSIYNYFVFELTAPNLYCPPFFRIKVACFVGADTTYPCNTVAVSCAGFLSSPWWIALCLILGKY